MTIEEEGILLLSPVRLVDKMTDGAGGTINQDTVTVEKKAISTTRITSHTSIQIEEGTDLMRRVTIVTIDTTIAEKGNSFSLLIL